MKDLLRLPLKNLADKKSEELLLVDLWCHLGKVYVSNVDQGKLNYFEVHDIQHIQRLLLVERYIRLLHFVYILHLLIDLQNKFQTKHKRK